MPKTTTKKGMIYNNLKAIEHSFIRNKVTYWKFTCLYCNKEHTAALQDVRRGKTKSCGCQKNKGEKNGQWKGHLEISGSTFSHYKYNADLRNIPFEVTLEDLWEIYIKQDKKCPYTGIDLVLENKTTISRVPPNASLDRIDSKVGYKIGNIQWVYKPINVFKGGKKHEEFISLCKMITDYQVTKNKIIIEHCPYKDEGDEYRERHFDNYED